MSNVSLSIGGKSFTVACAPGEEAHVRDLGRLIDSKIARMGDISGQSESRVLLFAALLMADELHEHGIAAPRPPAPELPEDFEARLDAIAGRLENLALRLESDGTNA